MHHDKICLIKETRQSKIIPKIMDEIGPSLTLRPSDKVAIKINLAGSREIYANTHYETVESLIIYLKDNFGVTDISVIEGSSGAFHSSKSTWDIFYKFRYKEVELNGAKLVNLDELPHDKTLNVYTKSGTKTVHFAEFEADYIIAVAPPKTHKIFPVSVSILDTVGYVKPEERVLMFGASRSEMRKLNYSNPEEFAKLIDDGGKNFARLYKKVPFSLVIVDGLYGMEGKGPINGSPVFHGFALACEDAVLADSLTAYIMGFDSSEISYLTYAYREGVGKNRWKKITGEDPGIVKFPYRPHPLFEKQKAWKKYYNNKKRDNREINGRKRDNKVPGSFEGGKTY